MSRIINDINEGSSQSPDLLCRDVNTFFCEQQINLLLINNRGINTCKLITS